MSQRLKPDHISDFAHAQLRVNQEALGAFDPDAGEKVREAQARGSLE